MQNDWAQAKSSPQAFLNLAILCLKNQKNFTGNVSFWLKVCIRISLGLNFSVATTTTREGAAVVFWMQTDLQVAKAADFSYLQPALFWALLSPAWALLAFESVLPYPPGSTTKLSGQQVCNLKHQLFPSIYAISKHHEIRKATENDRRNFTMLPFPSHVSFISSLQKKLLIFLAVTLLGYFVQMLKRAHSNSKSTALR